MAPQQHATKIILTNYQLSIANYSIPNYPMQLLNYQFPITQCVRACVRARRLSVADSRAGEFAERNRRGFKARGKSL